MVESSSMWLIFFLIIIGLLSFDLGILQKRRANREISLKESLWISGFYMASGLLFSIWIGYMLGENAAKEYLTGFVLEKTLSLDNIFVISLLFQYFAIPSQYQYRVLFWGILGVIILRGMLIGLGSLLISRFHIILDVFAILLMITGIKMLRMNNPLTIPNNSLITWVKRWLPLTSDLHGKQFWVKLDNPQKPGQSKWMATPLFLALLVIECVDLIFALDSIPAIFSITTHPYIVFTSNLFAILGLRALYFALNTQVQRFHYLKYALSLLLVFIGAKVLVAKWLGLGNFPTSISLIVTFALILGGISYSIYRTKKN